MSVVMISDTATDSIDQYDQIIRLLDDAGLGAPAGRLLHVCAAKENGTYFVVDVWDSTEDFDRFAESLVPLIQQVGGSKPDIQFSPVHHTISAQASLTR